MEGHLFGLIITGITAASGAVGAVGAYAWMHRETRQSVDTLMNPEHGAVRQTSCRERRKGLSDLLQFKIEQQRLDISELKADMKNVLEGQTKILARLGLQK